MLIGRIFQIDCIKQQMHIQQINGEMWIGSYPKILDTIVKMGMTNFYKKLFDRVFFVFDTAGSIITSINNYVVEEDF